MEDQSLEFDFKSAGFIDDLGLEEAEMEDSLRKEYILEVDFKGSRKGYYLNNKAVSLRVGDFVLVECDNGEDMGRVTALIKKSLRQELTEDGEIIRKANSIDLRRLEENRLIEDKILIEARRQAKKLTLDMKFIDIEYKFDRKKLVFYFTADGRVDFRELVKVFASDYRTRIELRQIGVRDEAQRIGGIGICGRELCCSKFLKNFVSINVAMARDQNLYVKPEKFSGACGKLMCCLKYEHEFYLNAKVGIPEIGTVIKTTKGTWFVIGMDVFKKSITLSSNSNDMITYSFEMVGELIKLLSPDSIIAGGNSSNGNGHSEVEGVVIPKESCGSSCDNSDCAKGCKVSDIDLIAFKKKFEKDEPVDLNKEESRDEEFSVSKKEQKKTTSEPSFKSTITKSEPTERNQKHSSINSSENSQRNSNNQRQTRPTQNREPVKTNNILAEKRLPKIVEAIEDNPILADIKELPPKQHIHTPKNIQKNRPLDNKEDNRPKKNLNRDFDLNSPKKGNDPKASKLNSANDLLQNRNINKNTPTNLNQQKASKPLGSIDLTARPKQEKSNLNKPNTNAKLPTPTAPDRKKEE